MCETPYSTPYDLHTCSHIASMFQETPNPKSQSPKLHNPKPCSQAMHLQEDLYELSLGAFRQLAAKIEELSVQVQAGASQDNTISIDLGSWFLGLSLQVQVGLFLRRWLLPQRHVRDLRDSLQESC